MVLIADSGSTKTSWVQIINNETRGPWETIGFNPYFHDELSITGEIQQHLVPHIESVPEQIFFYGSGCKATENQSKVTNAIKAVFSSASIKVDHDLTGACRSLSKFEPGIVCILGTGSNSCYYDGKEIISNQTSLGYVLGDEGSGAVLGTHLLRDHLYNKLPKELQDSFSEAYSLDPFLLLRQVYMQPFPNRFLAKFTKFLFENITHPYVQNLVRSQFELFIQRNILEYQQPSLPVHFMGSIALYFQDILQSMCEEKAIKTGTITNNAIPGLVDYHKTILGKTL